MTGINTILTELKESIGQNTFVRLTLSKSRTKNADLKKVIIKLAIIKKVQQLSFVYRHQTKDITKNYLVEEGITIVQDLLENQFLITNLFTTKEDVSLEVAASGKERIQRKAPNFTAVPERNHDKQKKRLIESTSYLKELGILDNKDRIKRDKGDKFKQINKFVEIIDGLIRNTPSLETDKPIKVVDMGAGKGYLTFALYDYLVNTLKTKATIKGVEVRADLIKLCNQIAQKVNFDNLSFELGYISDFDLPSTDILIALHACDTATDDAIFKGIEANAKLIICAPCCHKQIRKEIKSSDTLQPILDFGILKERQAEMITDTIRALLLEAAGYKTKVFEFISTEHTGKNVMIVGQKHDGVVETEMILEKVDKLKKEFGIGYHYLERLLA